jgi:formate C-acetyltransferase
MAERKEELLERNTTIEPTARVKRLREAYLDFEPTASVIRARIETRVMKETVADPVITRRAKIFAAVAREMPIEIYDDELFVGCSSVRPRCVDITPGTDTNVSEQRAYRFGYRADTVSFSLSEDERKELDEVINPYWKAQGRPSRLNHYGHNVHNWEKVLKKGFLGIKKDAEERLARLDLTKPEDLKKIPFLEGVVMVMQASAEIGHRYAALARQLVKKEPDSKRKAELLKIAETCERVPGNPARTFYEAIQSFYFAWFMLQWETWGSVGRIDQYLYPYYERDIREGRLTKEEAQELIDCLIIKLNQGQILQTTNTIGVSGLKTNGTDATNELSFMFIESMMHTRLTNWFAVMIHSKTPEDLLIKACQLCSIGGGHPQFLNVDVGVAQMLARGNMGGPMVTLEDARNAANVGCLELVVPGKDSGYLYTATHNLALAMEMVLTNGVRRLDQAKTGSKAFVPTRRYFKGVQKGDPRDFKSFGEVREAFRQQVVEMRKKTQIDGIIYEQMVIDFYPTVYESALIEDCIEKGVCREEGGAHYNFNTGGTEVGSSDAADSLAAIKKLVFDEKRITMSQLCDALDNNFEGYEDIRKMCLEAPKFGNDDDYVDEQKAWVIHQWASEFMKLTNLRGGHGCPGGSSMTAFISEGKAVGALPSGRLAGEPLAPAGSPGIGKDRNGVTSVLKSMGKVDGIEVLGGLSLTSRIDPAVFQKADGVKRMADLMRTFVDQKVFHVQFNVVSSEMLREAQQEPEKYRDLMVKVAGWNAYFTQLHKDVQDSIIARTEHGF